jgi:hypothetical protein
LRDWRSHGSSISVWISISAQGIVILADRAFPGMWPFVRNLIWTGDPFFPMLVTRPIPGRMNSTALAALPAETGAPNSHSLLHAIPYSFFSSSRSGTSPGLAEFCGPVVLALAPLAILACRNTREWRVRFFVRLLAGLGIYLALGMTRFLLPLLPIALSCAAAGVYYAGRKGWVQIHRLAA